MFNHDRATPAGTEPRDVTVEFYASEASEASEAVPTNDADETNRGRRIARFLPVLAAVVLGVCIGRASAPVRTAVPRPPAQPTVPGCQRQHMCAARETRIPLLTTLLTTDFPDALSTEVTATDDVNTGRRDRIQLVSRLARGVTITVTAQPAQHPAPTHWVFVAVGTSAQPAYAERVLLADGISTADARVRIARSGVPIKRLGRGDFLRTEPSSPDHRADDAPILARMRSSEPQLSYLLGLGVHSAVGSEALSWLG